MPMENIGERLKRKREELGLSIEAAAEATKFRPELIRDVEEGRPGQFGARVYQEGFVRTYARFLGLDGDALIRDQKSEEERAQEALRGLRPSPVQRPGLRRTAIGIVAVAAIAVAVFVLVDRAGRQSAENGERKVGVGARAAESTEAGGSLAGDHRGRRVPIPKLQPASAESVAADRSHVSEVPQETGPAAESGRASGDRLFPTLAPKAEAALAESAGGAPVDTSADAMAGPSAGEPKGGSQPEKAPPPDEESVGRASSGKHTLEIAARRSVNLTVKNGDKFALDNYWMKRGERVVYTGDGPFVIVSLSDREAVSISIDNSTVNLPASEEHGLFNWPIPSGR
jgi:cytoskeleton protein RodZ